MMKNIVVLGGDGASPEVSEAGAGPVEKQQ